jgi:hypothetical protein
MWASADTYPHFQFFNTALHADVFIMVTHGGFGFHVQEIAMRFGPDVLTLFFKVHPQENLPTSSVLQFH